MKKTITLMIVAILLFACKTSSITDKKLDRKAQVAIKGNWVINSVYYPGSEYIKVNTFQLADSKCFEGSTWKFISNNNKGNMALTKSDCITFSSPITWFVNKDGQFVLKILNAGEKAKKVREGYILYLVNQTADSFQLIDKINVGGKMTDVVYQFNRTN
ncbi:lipocalin family protein [Flavobacterium cellulosilyticum]|uniref:Uncharacterized protein n=1 Tax=Flavobacterium cellulosilyticum TaxID=2541731 RepID=A0A4R5CJ44_9FLAO|nr:lipocalin family protein [Flavobacterium cellulosilyticum]TDD97402.1 hypothetical protein E0F76_08825 [Flavobacterium cellulosilyticum]